jgi:hypothetical protein
MSLSMESPPFQKGGAGAGTEAFPSECQVSIPGWTRTPLAEYTHA